MSVRGLVGSDPFRGRLGMIRTGAGVATGEAIGEAYEAATDEARHLGMFDTPAFVMQRESSWGDDRLDAIAWHQDRKLTREVIERGCVRRNFVKMGHISRMSPASRVAPAC
jgi:hypothetical protein